MATSLASAPKAGEKGAVTTSGKDDGAEAKGGKKKLIVIIGVVLVVAVAAYFFVLKPKGGAAAKPKPPVPGEIVKLDSISVNLAGGHFLKIGIALQGTKAAKELDGAKALDLTIAEFSGKPMDELAKPKERTKIKKELQAEISEAYEKEVMAIYFTDFVMQ